MDKKGEGLHHGGEDDSTTDKKCDKFYDVYGPQVIIVLLFCYSMAMFLFSFKILILMVKFFFLILSKFSNRDWIKAKLFIW